MKLNYECLRDTLLFLEENLTLEGDIALQNIKINYSSENIKYCVLKLAEVNYIKIETFYADGIDDIYIHDITIFGHEFLNSVRPQTIWEETKSYSKKIGVQTIYTLTEIALKIFTQKYL